MRFDIIGFNYNLNFPMSSQEASRKSLSMDRRPRAHFHARRLSTDPLRNTGSAPTM
jgi:hypothetical protein